MTLITAGTHTNLMEHKVIRTSGRGGAFCNSCCNEIPCGEDRHEWRMHLSSNKWHNGSFWTTQCRECFKKSITDWRDSINNTLEILEK